MNRPSAESGSAGMRCETALVTGGTGFLGTSLTRRLLAEGTRVRVLARSPAKAEPLAGLGAEITIGDINDRSVVSAALTGMQVVFHLAGPLLLPDVPSAEYVRTHVHGTELLLECCEQAHSLERLVYCSTTGVLGVTGDQPADEDAPIRPTTIYERSKADAELAVWRRSRDGLPAVIARPGLVYGPGDLHLLSFFEAILHRRFRPIGRSEARLHPIYIEDMTEALIRCGQASAAIGERFHLAGRQPVAIGELARVIASALGTRLPRGHIPVLAAQAVAEGGDRLPPRLRRHAPLTHSRLEFLTNSRVYDVSKAARLLGFAAATDLPAGIARTVIWYREQGYLPAGVTSESAAGKGVAECEFATTP